MASSGGTGPYREPARDVVRSLEMRTAWGRPGVSDACPADTALRERLDVKRHLFLIAA